MKQTENTTIHVYVSTYCQHSQHDRCRLHCKICETPCRCPCHEAGHGHPEDATIRYEEQR